eukprot:1355780-Rhodomonas_salina.1
MAASPSCTCVPAKTAGDTPPPSSPPETHSPFRFIAASPVGEEGRGRRVEGEREGGGRRERGGACVSMESAKSRGER